MFLEKIRYAYFSWFGVILGLFIGGFGLYLQWTNPFYSSQSFLFNVFLTISGTLIIISVYNNTQNQFITETRKLDLCLELIFDNAQKYIIIISPYFKAGDNRIRTILNARDRNVHVTIIVCSRALINKSGVEELTKLKDRGCLIKVHPDIHSKIYLNDKEVLTGSINLVDGSFRKSLEFGTYTRNVGYHKEVVELVKNSYLKADGIKDFDPQLIETGYCIRTKAMINYDINTPIERNEYLSNYDRTGMYCHKCGKKSNTTASEPLCNDCKKKSIKK